MSIQIARHFIADGLCVLIFIVTLGVSMYWAHQDYLAKKIDIYKRGFKIGTRLAILTLVLVWAAHRFSEDMKELHSTPITQH